MATYKVYASVSKEFPVEVEMELESYDTEDSLEDRALAVLNAMLQYNLHPLTDVDLCRASKKSQWRVRQKDIVVVPKE